MGFPIEDVQQRDSYGGSLERWVTRVRGTEYECSECGTAFVIGDGDSEIYAYIRYPDGIGEWVQAQVQDVLGLERNLSRVCDDVAAAALNDGDGNRASAFFTCPACSYRHCHHADGVPDPDE